MQWAIFLVWWEARGDNYGDDYDNDDKAMIGTMTNAMSKAIGGGRRRSLGVDDLEEGTAQSSSPGRRCH
jgi:hypothetical protein